MSRLLDFQKNQLKMGIRWSLYINNKNGRIYSQQRSAIDMESNTFLACELDEYQARGRLVNKRIRIYRPTDSKLGGVDQVILVDSIESGVGDDDLPTDVAYYINQGIRVWKKDDEMTITIL